MALPEVKVLLCFARVLNFKMPAIFCGPRLLNITQLSVDFVREFQNKVQPGCWNRTVGTCTHMRACTCVHIHTQSSSASLFIVAVLGAEPFSA